MTRKNIFSIAFTVCSLILLIPGLMFPILTVSISVNVPILNRINLYEETRSIIGTISSLIESENYIVAVLILAFGIIVPVFKSASVLIFHTITDPFQKQRLRKLLSSIGKWSMADVFTVGVLIAFLSAKSNENITALLHEGFYYFAGYCLISLLGIQFLRQGETQEEEVQTK